MVARASLAIQSSYPGELIGEVSDLSPQVSGILAEVPVRIGDVVVREDTQANRGYVRTVAHLVKVEEID